MQETLGAVKRSDDVLCDGNEEKPPHWARRDFESAQLQVVATVSELNPEAYGWPHISQIFKNRSQILKK